MGRIRTIKPELFQHSDLYELEVSTKLPIRLSWAGLFCCCDRDGRFKWKPRELKLQVLPYDDVDFSRVLDALATRGFLVKYAVGDSTYGCIPTWKDHQFINNREAESTIPEYQQNQRLDVSMTREPRVEDAPLGEGKGREGKGRGSRVDDAEIELPEWASKELWDDFVANRKRMKKELTPNAKRLRADLLDFRERQMGVLALS